MKRANRRELYRRFANKIEKARRRGAISRTPRFFLAASRFFAEMLTQQKKIGARVEFFCFFTCFLAVVCEKFPLVHYVNVSKIFLRLKI